MISLGDKLADLFKRVLPTLVVHQVDEGIEVKLASGRGWLDVGIDWAARSVVEPYVVWLVPDNQVVFKLCRFPIEAVPFSALGEAVQLDVEEWSPWGRAVELFAWPERVGEEWQVSIWSWSSDERERREQLFPDLKVTHVVPEGVWEIASTQLPAESSLIFLGRKTESGGRYYYGLSQSGVPKSMVEINSKAREKHFFHAMKGALKGVGAIVSPEAEDRACLGDISIEEINSPAQGVFWSVLRNAQLAGVRGWAYPVAWKKPIFALLGLLLVWGSASYGGILYREMVVEKLSQEAFQDASKVLSVRERFYVHQDALKKLQYLEGQSVRPLQLLALLSEKLPKNIWLSSLQYSEEWLDIYGSGEDVAVLPGLLEQEALVESVEYMSEIQVDGLSGLEKFHLRVVLRQPEHL